MLHHSEGVDPDLYKDDYVSFVLSLLVVPSPAIFFCFSDNIIFFQWNSMSNDKMIWKSDFKYRKRVFNLEKMVFEFEKRVCESKK